jgi:hypothetical protein
MLASQAMSLDEARGFVWFAGGFRELNALIDPATGWTILEGRGINNQGAIAASALNPQGQLRAVLLRPTDNHPPLAPSFAQRTRVSDVLYIDVLSRASDADGDPLRVLSVSPARHGTVALTPEGLVRYEPPDALLGEDVFEYVVADSRGASATGRVTVMIDAELPDRVLLDANYPNPFNPVTRIRFALPEPMHARLEIHDAMGRQVAVLFDGESREGDHEVAFEARDLASGVYFYRLAAGGQVLVRRMLLLK